jgi:hypothetical protein
MHWREGLVESDLRKFRTTRLGCQRLVLCDALPVRRRVDATRTHGLAKCAQRQTKPIALVHRATRRTPRTRVVWSQALEKNVDVTFLPFIFFLRHSKNTALLPHN